MEVLSSTAQGAIVPLPTTEFRLPPSPAATVKDISNSSTDVESCASSDLEGSVCEAVDELGTEGYRLYPLPPTPKRDNKVLPEDLKTPDNHVERDPRLIRLTGIHPFNVEAPLSDLYDEGFLTTKDLFYVRNHGPVPRVEDFEVLDWQFSIEGMVENPVKLTLRDLLREYEQFTYPITLVCAGNRRKEQNMVRKTKGFSWGAAGVSTALWTGVGLWDLLGRAMPKRGARYVCFEGADRLPNGYYGTSVKLNWAVDANRGILVAHKMNGEALHPDHGKPLRIVIPGQIGGRSVKWLKRIIVTARPSDNWYHIYDNRVLPTMVDPEQSANLPETWEDERYAIYDLNTNSAICYPAHDERVSLVEKGVEMYKFKGYAYAGGGKRVTRMEVTLDKGKTWRLANITYHEDQYRDAPDGETLYGGRVDMSWREACFCWCFWDLDIPLADLADAKDVMVRAMDDSMMVQPRDMYWSVLGMMNNPWFRVVIHKEDSGHSLRFEHPTQPALMPGGWMERVKKEGGNLSNGLWGEKVSGEDDTNTQKEAVAEKEICMTNPKINKDITIDELRKHDGEEHPWFVVNGQVYDGTKFLEAHPGGAASIVGAAGQDATEEFMTIHSENAKAMMPEYHIGSLDEKSKTLLSEPEPAESEKTRPVFLQSKAWNKAIIIQKKQISADTKIFTFKLNHDKQTVGLPIGQHLMMRLRDPATREAIIRAYTPISEGTGRGILHVLVKIYYKTADREGGKMTLALDSLPIGHPVDFKGPVGKFEYLGKGRCTINSKERRVKRFVMVCAGSGITPIFQVLRAVMKDREDETKCVVLDGNRVEEDILCKEELDKMAQGNEEKCKLIYTLSKPSDEWKGLRGRMDQGLFEREVGAPRKGDDTMVLICGPEAMEKSVHRIFNGLGWRDEDLLFF
ncbi:hypothetical protein QBC46DRAFT_341343 [Diplogelasinospora grovesii]|uniref:Nitrate reductase n=1 Tax=Diplogelasinospora grovesii TaxID=303347 RepID=A0AAN6N7P3_9PEZI|nr:hypothetical protein QBC46DRAFT_341343 [Diplogelasinospora grovesii]